MHKYYLKEERATVYTGKTSVTVYGEIARFVNTVIVATVSIAAIAFLCKMLKSRF